MLCGTVKCVTKYSGKFEKIESREFINKSEKLANWGT